MFPTVRHPFTRTLCTCHNVFVWHFFVLLPFFFVTFIGLSCLCWQVVFVCRVIESIVSGSSMRQSSESAFYGGLFFLGGSFCSPCCSCCPDRVYTANIRLVNCYRGRWLTRVNKLVGLSLSTEAEKVVC